MDKGLPLDDDETAHFVKLEPYLLMSRRMQLRDLQTAHRLIGKKKTNKKTHLRHVVTGLLCTITGPFIKFIYLAGHFIGIQLLDID